MFFLAFVSCVFWRILALEVVHCVTGIFWCRRTRGDWREPCGSAIMAPSLHCNGPFGTGPTITIPGAVRNPNGSRPCSAGFPSVFWTLAFLSFLWPGLWENEMWRSEIGFREQHPKSGCGEPMRCTELVFGVAIYVMGNSSWRLRSLCSLLGFSAEPMRCLS